jgi:hypothetical protein
MAHVEWLESALNELAACWSLANSAERRAITGASDNIDFVLARNPYEGESRFDDVRVAFFMPLVVLFRVENDGETVAIVHVRVRRGGK